MSATITVTGVVGPAITMTAQTFTGIESFGFNCAGVNEVFYMFFVDGRTPLYISIAAATTITITTSGTAYTVTIS